MANIETTVIDPGTIVIDGKTFRDELLTLGGAAEVKAGTILARNTSSLKMQIYVKGGSSNGNGVPQAVLPYAVSALGAGDVPVRVLTFGTLNKKRLVIHADGDDSNIDATVFDLLRAHGMFPEDLQQLGQPDNLGGADS